MRVAKQKRSDDISDRAQQMAANRISNLYQQINEETNQSLFRAQDANREMHRMQVLSNTELGRRNKFIAKNENGNSTTLYQSNQTNQNQRRNRVPDQRRREQTQNRQPIRTVNHPRNTTQQNNRVQRNPIQQNKRVQRRNIQQNKRVQRNPIQQTNRVHRRNQSQQTNRVHRRNPIQQQRKIPPKQRRRRVQNQHQGQSHNSIQNQRSTKVAKWNGITQNPAEQARRRKKLEARIRELAN